MTTDTPRDREDLVIALSVASNELTQFRTQVGKGRRDPTEAPIRPLPEDPFGRGIPRVFELLEEEDEDRLAWINGELNGRVATAAPPRETPEGSEVDDVN
ncbi:hypothetical protein BSKO_12511 [Bryopsis sp. KO-2023]|nr:hypothetical protein BSKO_12511 [Bryopsis sp. KO-2023]